MSRLTIRPYPCRYIFNAWSIKHVYLAIGRHALLYVGYLVMLRDVMQYDVPTNRLLTRTYAVRKPKCSSKYQMVRTMYQLMNSRERKGKKDKATGTLAS